MKKNLLILLATSLLILLGNSAKAQFESANLKIIDDGSKEIPNPRDLDRRSVENPTQCGVDTLDYARFKATGQLQTVTNYSGRGLGQFYDAPQNITVHGASFYAFLTANSSSITGTVYVNLYRANTDSLPVGAPLRSDTITIDTVFGGGVIANFVRHANWTPITLNHDYIIAVETVVTDTNRVAIVCNDWNARNGRGMFLNCGSINGIWYRGRNLTIGTAQFDADILINPHVSYQLAADFDILTQCFESGQTVDFQNKHIPSVLSSPFYNRYAFNNTQQFSHLWNYGINQFTTDFRIDGQSLFPNPIEYNVRLVSRVLQWRLNPTTFCNDTTIKKLYPKPQYPILSGTGNYCENDEGKAIALNSNGKTTKWYGNISSSDSIHMGDTLVINPLLNDTTVYARITDDFCQSDPVAVNFTVLAYPDVPTVKDDSICSGSRASLIAISSNALAINWYRDSSYNFPLATGNVYQTAILNKDTFFYAGASNLQCRSNGLIKARVFVDNDFAPSEPTVEGDTFVCLSSNPQVNISASILTSDQIRWFNTASGGLPVHNGNSYIVPIQSRGTFIYYAEAWNGVCGSSRIPVTITIENAPELNSVSEPEICSGQNATLIASVPFGGIKWYTSPSSGSSLYTGTNLFVPNVKNDSTFYIETFSSTCNSTNRTPATIIVNKPADFTSLSGDTICSGKPAILKGVVPFGQIQWFNELTDNTPVGTGFSYTTQNLLGARDFYAASIYKGCLSPKISVRPLVNPTPFSGFFYDNLDDQRIQLTPLTTTGNTYNWNFGDGNTSIQTSPTHRYNDSGFYDIRLILTSIMNGCKDTTINRVYIPHWDPSSVKEINLNGIFIYPNPTNGIINVVSKTNFSSMNYKAYNLQGKIVAEGVLDDMFENVPKSINLNLTSGVYLFKIENQTIKIIFD